MRANLSADVEGIEPTIDDETVAKFNDLDTVGDLRPLMREALQGPEPDIQTPDLISTGETSALALPLQPWWHPIFSAFSFKKRLFPRRYRPEKRSSRHPWYEDGRKLLVAGILAVLLAGLFTAAVTLAASL